MSGIRIIAIVLLFCATQASAQTSKQMTISELATYSGKDREALLYAGAKKEGKVTWYTSLAARTKQWRKPLKQSIPACRLNRTGFPVPI